MSKDKVVIFQDSWARIVINPDVHTLEQLQEANITFFVNPDLSAVSGIPPEFWKLQDSKIIPMSQDEQEARHKEEGLDQPFEPIIIERIKHIPVETTVIKEVEKRVEVPIEIIKYIDRIIEKPIEVIKEVEKIVDREVKVEVPVIKEVIKQIIVEKPIDKLVEVRVPYIVNKIPTWAKYGVLLAIIELVFILIQFSGR